MKTNERSIEALKAECKATARVFEFFAALVACLLLGLGILAAAL